MRIPLKQFKGMSAGALTAWLAFGTALAVILAGLVLKLLFKLEPDDVGVYVVVLIVITPIALTLIHGLTQGLARWPDHLDIPIAKVCYRCKWTLRALAIWGVYLLWFTKFLGPLHPLVFLLPGVVADCLRPLYRQRVRSRSR